MRALQKLVGTVGGAAILILAVGCSDPAADMQISALQERVARLKGEQRDMYQQLAAAHDARERDGRLSAQQLRDLETQLADARRQLADAPATVVKSGSFTEAGGIAWANIAENILFDSGEAKIKPQGRERLRDLVREIQAKYSDRDIWVVGHTDNDPIIRTKELYDDNRQLSQMRGYKVTMVLAELGIENERLISGGQGQYRPLVSNDSKANKAKNRRVEIIAVRRPGVDELGVQPQAQGG